MSNTFHKLRVSGVKAETKDCVSVSFEVPESLKETFHYKQGQYLTLRFQLNGKEERRAYSMSSAPYEKDLTVTVKRLKGGLVSNHINDNIKAGAAVEVMPPEGRFFTKIEENHKKSYYLFAAGSGITPLMSMLKTIIEKEPMSTVFLLYGNRDKEDIIFRESLADLEARYSGQLIVEQTLSGVKKKTGGLSSWFKRKPVSTWSGKAGRIGGKLLTLFLEEYQPRHPEQEYFICGPAEMIETVKAELLKRDIDKKRIHVEYFTAADKKDAAVPGASAAGGACRVKVKLNGKEFEVVVPEDKTVLDALLDDKHEPPYSCTSGSCSTCMAKVLKGKAEMEACYALDDDEIEEGYILTCQAHPVTAALEIDYDV